MPSYVRAGIRKCARIRALSNPKPLFDAFCSYPLTHDFAATICGFLILVDSSSVRNAAKLKMKDFLQRLINALLNATFVF